MIKLENALISVEIEELGAQLKSLTDVHKTEYIWQRDGEFWSSSAPLLFPIVGNLRSGTAQINGQEYKMARHGIARSSEFSVISNTSNSALLELKSSSETKKQYPFDFTLQALYEIFNNSLKLTLKVHNNGKEDMPYCIGGHPAFNVPLDKSEDFEDFIVKFPQGETANCPKIDMTTGGILSETKRVLQNEDTIELSHDLFYNDAIIIENIKSKSAQLFSTVSGKGVRFDFENFKHFALWSSVNDGNFVALEPWTATAFRENESDNFYEKQDVILLPENQTAEHSYTITTL